jgi:hypothetical protein
MSILQMWLAVLIGWPAQSGVSNDVGAIVDATARQCPAARRSEPSANPATRWRAGSKQSISGTERRTLHGASEHGPLLKERQVLERDGSMFAAEQREGSEDDESATNMRYPVAKSITVSTGATDDLVLAKER